MQSMLMQQQGQVANAAAAPAAVPVGADLDKVGQLLDFHAQRGAALDKALYSLQQDLKQAKEDEEAARATLDRLRGCAGVLRVSNDVTVLMSVRSPCTVELSVTYLVSGASWHSSYDIRVDEAKDGDGKDTKSLTLTYFGVVKQNTGEDWESVLLSLSTAVPARGGCPPLPPTKTVGWKVQYQPLQLASYGARTRGSMPMQARGVPMQAMGRALSISARELDDGTDAQYSDDDEDGRWDEDAPAGAVATAAVRDQATGSSSFAIERRSTVASDNNDHKSTITIVQLEASFRHFATPALEEVAYLQARAVNTTAFPFLASSAVSIFISGSFVTTTALKHTSPGETFNLFLGVDPAVKVEHRMVKQSHKKGDAGGLLKSRQLSTQLYEYRTLLQNTKGSDVELTLVNLMPRSNDDKISVELLAPAPSEVNQAKANDNNEADDTVVTAAAAGAGKTKIVQNKVTNNLVHSMALPAGSKLEVPFTYRLCFPHDKEVQIN